MSFGLRTWDASSNIEMDTDTFTYQVIHNELFDFNVISSVTRSIAGFDPAKCAAALLPLGDYNPGTPMIAANTMPYMTVAVGSVTIRAMHPLETEPADRSRLKVRLLVMRLKN